ncbi:MULTISPECIES: SDR family NAD(P)-dependent oxidoreductase [Agrobacterium]|uniref:SDR family oxidoreductase n=1 Tax=Agrobacterium pusense TaxID=648995 RepID=A0AA44IXD1_9HYPH|nr:MULTISPECIES: SDR family NAD(P)-dependent oxidoreductase [Agrobacterium]ANV25457.1 short-chain dehydrogenase [Rhizobium sp. S41]KGE79893.1 short-chain dehydrogenase [Rhizobium sp. H41]MCZ7866062.1 SDR family NAD(P)-dependent oxidoreductase [Agrobacterium salinitolerans]MDA5639534.1 SDR family NAD(P)-dependent oxidoreductase [Agrobacterium sp. ST15.13.013]MDA6999570.1 SDR family NAD(P)-dependent oxidoreductase [Agrobacterium salinitolerans]
MSDGQAKVAIVTGSGRGIGRACALDLARHGFDIAPVDLIEDDLARTAAEIRELGRKALTFIADVSDHARAAEIAAEVDRQWGRIDVLFNNAGRSMSKGIEEISEQEFDDTIAINLKGAFNYIQPTVPVMRRNGGGRIINMSSMNAHTGGVTSAVSKFSYTAAKAGIIGMTKALAKELAPEIVVNAVCPGVIKTERSNAMIDARETSLAAGISLGRVGTPQDVASVVTFLATAEPNFITGQDIQIDGMQWVR